MGDKHQERWMDFLPYVLLGKKVTYQPDLGTSAAELTLGGSPVLPGVVVPDVNPSERKSNHELLKTLQTKASVPAVPMSRHSGPPEVYEPPDFHSATHVYIKIDKPNNLGEKWQGPFIIVDRPTNTTVTIRVGYDKDGFPRLECHHWNNCRIAYLHPDVQDAQRPQRGRPRSSPTNFNMAAETTLPEQNENLPPNFHNKQNNATLPPQQLTQPRKQGGRHWLANSAEMAEIGRETPLAASVPCTGPPPNRPFSPPLQQPPPFTQQQKQTSLPTLIDDDNSRPEPGATSSSPQGSGSHPCFNEPQSSPSGAALPASPATAGHLRDHDYISSRPPPLTDHTYFMSVPAPEPTTVLPPPGFEHYQSGRPKRQTNKPVKLNDYDLS